MQVKAYDKIAGTNITFGLAQSLGICSLRPSQESAQSAEFQDAKAQRGCVHLPAIIIHILYEALLDSKVLKSKNRLYQGWSSNMLVSLLLHSRSKEYIDGAAIALKMEILRILHGKQTTVLRKLIPMQVRT